MPLVNVTDEPVMMRELSFVVNTDGTDPLHLMCVINSFSHTAVTEKKDAKTVCKPGRKVNGATTETINATLQLSPGPNGSINKLVALENQTVSFSWVYEGDVPVGPNNPEFSGRLQIEPLSLAAGEINAPQFVDVSWEVDGRVAKNFTTTPVYPNHHGIL